MVRYYTVLYENFKEYGINALPTVLNVIRIRKADKDVFDYISKKYVTYKKTGNTFGFDRLFEIVDDIHANDKFERSDKDDICDLLAQGYLYHHVHHIRIKKINDENFIDIK